ncbi:MAG TPA: DoxX family protein [Puia sp.]|jgi:putative oxidoreductase|nr:DoxX family protein [Puia sp.]
MRKLLSTSYSDGAFNFAMLVQRVVTGLLLLIGHGLPKIQNFSELSVNFYDPFRISHRGSLILVILAELFCSMLLVLGLFTRIVAFIIVINLSVAVFIYHNGQPLKNVDLGAIYLTNVFTIMILGPGKVSVDGMMGK